MNNLASAQRTYDAQLPPEYHDDGATDRKERDARLLAGERFLRVVQRGDPAVTLPTSGVVKNTDIVTLLTYLSNDCAKLLLAACAQALKPGASLGSPERLCEDRVVADLLRKFMAEMGAEYASDNVEAWL